MIQVSFFSSGNTMVFRDGKQAPELQVPWFRLFLEHLDALDIDPRDVAFTMPDGHFAKVSLAGNDDDFNWTIGGV